MLETGKFCASETLCEWQRKQIVRLTTYLAWAPPVPVKRDKGVPPMRKVLFAALGFAVLALGSTALSGPCGGKHTRSSFDPATAWNQSGDGVSWTTSDAVRHAG